MEIARGVAAKFNGKELPNSIPKAGRADPYSNLDAVLGPDGDRWIALNAKVAHSEAIKVSAAVEALLARYQADFDANGIIVSRLLTIIGNHVFSYEPVFNWHDSWLPIHHATISDDMRKRVSEPAANISARDVVHKVRAELVELFAEVGAQSNQIGRTYHFADALRPESLTFLEALKSAVDPKGQVNPGALGLGK
jgi:hypothetical protein